MNRQEWEFHYASDKLLEAATTKNKHHKDRSAWWKEKKAEVTAKIKAEGLEFDDSLAADNFGKFANSSYNRQTTVQVRNDLLNDLNECNQKVKEHHDKAIGYESWMQVLASQGSKAFALHQDDWLFFFGK